jgi:hypothetical protein
MRFLKSMERAQAALPEGCRKAASKPGELSFSRDILGLVIVLSGELAVPFTRNPLQRGLIPD